MSARQTTHPDTLAAVRQVVETGCTPAVAADAHGVADSTVRRAMRRLKVPVARPGRRWPKKLEGF